VFRAAAASQLSSEQPTRALNSQEKDACIGSLSLKLYRLTVAQAGHQLCGGLRHTHRERLWNSIFVKAKSSRAQVRLRASPSGTVARAMARMVARTLTNPSRFSRLAFRTGRSKFGILVRRDRKITPPAKIDASWFAWHHACWIDGHAPPTTPTRLSAVTTLSLPPLPCAVPSAIPPAEASPAPTSSTAIDSQ
jgi:hypothetical protein